MEPALAREIEAGVLGGIDAWYPGIARSQTILVDAGAIVAIGRSDVDDAGSGLHDRTRIGISSHDGFHSVDPGKLTTAPIFALAVSDRVEASTSSSAGARMTGSHPRVLALVPTWKAAGFIARTSTRSPRRLVRDCRS